MAGPGDWSGPARQQSTADELPGRGKTRSVNTLGLGQRMAKMKTKRCALFYSFVCMTFGASKLVSSMYTCACASAAALIGFAIQWMDVGSCSILHLATAARVTRPYSKDARATCSCSTSDRVSCDSNRLDILLLVLLMLLDIITISSSSSSSSSNMYIYIYIRSTIISSKIITISSSTIIPRFRPIPNFEFPYTVFARNKWLAARCEPHGQAS